MFQFLASQAFGHPQMDRITQTGTLQGEPRQMKANPNRKRVQKVFKLNEKTV
jgi:hypothetical protein